MPPFVAFCDAGEETPSGRFCQGPLSRRIVRHCRPGPTCIPLWGPQHRSIRADKGRRSRSNKRAAAARLEWLLYQGAAERFRHSGLCQGHLPRPSGAPEKSRDSVSRDDLIALLHALSGAASMAVSLITKTDLLTELGFVKPVGMIVFCAGMLLFALAAAQLGRGFWSNVQPVSDRLVTGGPYRLVRHPGYLGMIMSVVGLAIGMRSVWGLATCAVIFVPLGVYRARLEERMLAEKYGATWEAYARGTYFMFPPICSRLS